MALQVYYAAPEPLLGDVDHRILLDHLARYPVRVLRAKDALEACDGVVAELTITSERQIERVHNVAKELGKPALFLASRLDTAPIDERLRGLSKIQPDGVRYNNHVNARAAISLFLMLYLELNLPKDIDANTYRI